ncbi:MAG: hypothetical protein KF746_20095 [Chitinophagaceae bacterium]|nr:hypothetical protein [Chitinophagaceae bacterium]
MSGEESDLDKNKLLELLTEIKSTNADNRYFHLRSVENFLIHLDSFKDRTKKKRIIKYLGEYLTIIKSIGEKEEIITADCSRDLFHKYIYPVANLYSIYARFVHYPKFYVIVIWFGFFSLFIYLLGLSISFQATLVGLFIIYYLFIQHKKIKKCVYGLYF